MATNRKKLVVLPELIGKFGAQQGEMDLFLTRIKIH